MSLRRERGAGGVFIFVLLLLAMVVLVAMLTLTRTSTAVDEQAQTKTNLEAAAAALEQFAGASGRLPCPADPTKDDGLASPATANANCDFPSGTLPWVTIGMRRDDAFDAWGWKISYRVYSNVAGSLTQDQGASMVNCDSVQALTMRQPVDATTKLCPAAHETVDSDFLTGKGLSVTDFGTVYDATKATGGAAYVLISHGQTGLGAYSAAGIRKDLPTSTDEKNNTNGTGPFTLEAASAPDVASTAFGHYDDILLYRTVADLAKKANLAARDWHDDILAGVRFDQSTVGTALGSTPSGDLGTSTLTFPGMTVSAFDSGGAQDLAFVSSGTSGLGGSSGGSNNLSFTGGEGLRFDFTDAARQFSVSLASFNFGLFGADRAQLSFYTVDPKTNVATKMGSEVLKSACGLSSVASFTVDLSATGVTDTAATFNRVEVRPWMQTGLGLASSFRVSEVRTCVAGVTCETTLYNSGDQC